MEEKKKKEIHSMKKKTETNRQTATIKVNNFKINFKLDSAADINVLPKKNDKKNFLRGQN